MKNELNSEVLFSNLAQFTGTTQYYQITTRTVLTDGTRYLADAAGCYWLMDAIASHLAGLPEAAGFAHCTLKLDGQSAELTIGDVESWLSPLSLLDKSKIQICCISDARLWESDA
jgi:hypothetical protein